MGLDGTNGTNKMTIAPLQAATMPAVNRENRGVAAGVTAGVLTGGFAALGAMSMDFAPRSPIMLLALLPAAAVGIAVGTAPVRPKGFLESTEGRGLIAGGLSGGIACAVGGAILASAGHRLGGSVQGLVGGVIVGAVAGGMFGGIGHFFGNRDNPENTITQRKQP